MTDEELHALWVGGASYDAIRDQARCSRGSIASRIRRLRAKEGAERWPPRASPIVPRSKPVHVKRAGTSTLPPLSSLQ